MDDRKNATINRTRTTFPIPPGVREWDSDPKTVTMVALTVREEIEANKVADGRGTGDVGLSYELLRRSVVAKDGKPIDPTGTDLDWVEGTSPKCRSLLLQAVLRMNRVSREDSDAFFKGAVVESSG